LDLAPAFDVVLAPADLEIPDLAAAVFDAADLESGYVADDDFETDELVADDFAAGVVRRTAGRWVFAGALAGVPAGAAFLPLVGAVCASAAHAASHSTAIETARERKRVTVL